MAVLPLVMTPQGLQPIAPSDLRAALIALVAAAVPDYTANLPGTLIEDISSTDVYALVESDSFLVDLVNSVTPYGANPYLLNQLGVLYGVDKQPITNTSVYVVFNGPPGYVILQGFVVSDGTYQYVCQTGGICGADGNTLPIYALANQAGTWAVLPNTVVQLLTSTPANVTITVTNPVAGIPSQTGEPIGVYRERCWTAGLAASTGMGRYLKTLVGNVPGVENRLIAVQTIDDQFVIIVGGGDPYQVAYAIWQADFYIPGLSGSTITIDNISNTDPILIETVNKHNLLTGDVELLTEIQGGFNVLNAQKFPITVVDEWTFSIPVDGTKMGSYISGGVVSPNPINDYVSVSDFPDTYVIPFVIPPQELVTMTVTWYTDSPNYVSPDAVAQAANPELMDYINSLPAGTTPINLNVLNKVFLDAISSIVVGEYIIELQFQLAVNGVGVYPAAGTNVIYGDPYSYFFVESGGITILKGSP